MIKNEKQDHMALIAIVGIVAIVGLFLMFNSSNSASIASTDESSTLAGQAYLNQKPKATEEEINNKIDWASCNEYTGQSLSNCINALVEESLSEPSGKTEAGIMSPEVLNEMQNNWIAFCTEEAGGGWWNELQCGKWWGTIGPGSI